MVHIRQAVVEDFDFFYDMKCEDNNIFWTGHAEKPNKENLYSFFVNAVENAAGGGTRKIYIVLDEDVRVGHIYIIPDENQNGVFDLASAISHKYQGRGYGKMAVKLGLEEGKRLGFSKMIGAIREDNIASMKAYSSCGVRVTDKYNMVYIPMLGKEVRMYIIEIDLD